MTGAGEVIALLREVPPPGLVCCVTLGSAGAGSVLSAAVDTARMAGELVRRMRDQREFDRQFDQITGADPEIQAVVRASARLAANKRWTRGGPGEAETIVTWCLRPLMMPGCLLNAVSGAWNKVRARAARRGKRSE